jgi:hypothetical protein
MEMMLELWSLLEAGELDEHQRLWFEAPGEERLFDLDADPYELNNLLADPAHAAALQRMRRALSDWQAGVEDWSDVPEAQMLALFRPGGEAPETAAPQLLFRDGFLHLSSPTEGASLAYQLGDGAWELYTGPIALPAGTELAARAVRYGWQESAVVTGIAP